MSHILGCEELLHWVEELNGNPSVSPIPAHLFTGP